MIIDTNIIVRLIVKDDPKLLEESVEFFKKVEKGSATAEISILVIDETIWVLQNYYGLKRGVCLPKLLELLAYPKIKIVEISKEIIVKILNQMLSTKIDFTDYYLLAISGNEKLFSFDNDLKKLMTPKQVE